MTNVAIPDWNAQGILPPVDPDDPTSPDRSPYTVSLVDLVLRYGFSPQRIQILRGLLEFRAALHKTGLVNGFQWVDGSFLEKIETIENRAPNDVDLVTFFCLPKGVTQQALADSAIRLFDPIQTKTVYHVDAYFVELTSTTLEPLVNQSTYWYGLWSHRRNGQWKGYLQIDLSSGEDQVAGVNLAKKEREIEHE